MNLSNILNIIKSRVLTYNQKVINLAKEAENSVDVLTISDKTKYYMKKEVIHDMYEGLAPYCPRYVLPDYRILMNKGCAFLNLEPPKDIWEATHTLLVFYKHVPSVTTYPTFIGHLDDLLEPFVEDEVEAEKAIRLFLIHLDRTITDSFCHANIGPKETKVGRILLKLEKELQNAVPNITLKITDETPEDFIKESIKTALLVSKPSFANHEMFVKDLGEDYGIASCYNGLLIGGGSYTLVRLNLNKLARLAESKEAFMNTHLVDAVKEMCGLIDERSKFLVEESGFFESHFLGKEGFISKKRYTSIFGLVGLGDCVNILNKKEGLEQRFGHSKEADAFGKSIIQAIEDIVSTHHNPHCLGLDGRFLLQAQVGIDTDHDISPGCRIPIGDEPDELYDQIVTEAQFHKYFTAGVGNIYPFEKTADNNPVQVLDIMKGSFELGMRYFSINSTDADVIRITGYLVKLSDIRKLKDSRQVLGNSVILGMGAVDNQHILDRKINKS